MAPTIEKISAVTFRVLNMTESLRFYRDVLGMELLYGGECTEFSSLSTKDIQSAPRVEQRHEERQPFSTMPTPKESSENRTMHGIAVALLSEERDCLTTLQDRLRATSLGREVFSHIGLPTSGTDIIIRQLQESRAEVVIVDVHSKSVHRAHVSDSVSHATFELIKF